MNQVFSNLLEEVLKYKGEMRRQLYNPVSVKGGGNLVNLDVKPRASAALSEEAKRVIRSEIHYFLSYLEKINTQLVMVTNSLSNNQRNLRIFDKLYLKLRDKVANIVAAFKTGGALSCRRFRCA